MRTLTTVASATRVNAQVSISLMDVGSAGIGSTPYAFGDIAALPAVSWEVPFGGGLATAQILRATLSTSPGWFLQHRKRLPGAEARLTVNANSDVFQPFRGVVRGVETDPKDPNLYTLVMADRLLDADPLVPEIALTDSWANPHLEDLQSGYPLYYGDLTKRPIPFAGVTSDAGLFIGPRNVSSAAHNVRAYRWRPHDSQASAMFLSPAVNWNQQSGSDNLLLCGSGGEFLVSEINSANIQGLLSNPVGQARALSQWNLTSTGSLSIGSVQFFGRGLFIDSTGNITELAISVAPGSQVRYVASFLLDLFLFSNNVTSLQFGFTSKVGSVSQTVGRALFTAVNVRSVQAGGNLNGALTVGWAASPAGYLNFAFIPTYALDTTLYTRYSVYNDVNSLAAADLVALSTNPLAILDDVLSHYTSTPYQQAASSGAQLNLSSWQFNVLFHERQKQSAILADFCKQTGTYAWQADSGALGYRTYAESSVATNSIAATIATSDMLTFQLLTSPIGTTIFNQQGYSAFRLEWNYDFQLNKYQSVSVANKLNNALCNSAYASGAQKTLVLQSKFCMDSDTASYMLGHIARMGAQGQDYVIVDLPARYFGLEIADIINVQHPAIGSAGLFQVTKVQADYRSGTVKVTAGQLLSTAGN